MSRTRTLTELIADVRFQGSIEGFTVRHSDAQITRMLNQEIQAHREQVSLEGIANYLASYSTTFTSGNTSPFKYAVLNLASGPSPALTRLYGIDVIVGNEAKTLHPVAYSERNDYGGQPGEPECWAQITSYTFAILPAPAYAYTYIAHYLPKLADLATGSDTFDGVAGWEDVVVWGAVVRLIARDQFPQAYQLATQERARAEARVMANSKQTGKGVVHRRRDTWGERRRDARLRHSPWRWQA